MSNIFSGGNGRVYVRLSRQEDRDAFDEMKDVLKTLVGELPIIGDLVGPFSGRIPRVLNQLINDRGNDRRSAARDRRVLPALKQEQIERKYQDCLDRLLGKASSR